MPPETRKSIRQQIFDAIKVRFEDIRQDNGYATDIGAHCFAWRDLDKSGFVGAELVQGAINITDQNRAPGEGVLSVHEQILEVRVMAAASVESGSPPDDHCRRMEADLLMAIGVDRQWQVDGVKLAKDTIPGTSKINVGHFGDRVAAVELIFTVQFRTQRFDPYNL